MLLFRSEEEVTEWCARSGEPRGENVPLATVWKLAQLWYRGRMSPEYRGRSEAEAEAIFAAVGLTSDFWRFAET